MLKHKLGEDSSKISKDTVVHGSIQTKKNIVIHGEVLGYVASDNHIKISEKGSVENSITGKNCLIYGTVKGDVEADSEIMIGAEAEVEGNLICKKLRIEQGAALKLFQNMFEEKELYEEQLLVKNSEMESEKA